MNTSPFLCIRSLDITQASPFLQMAWQKIKRTHPHSLLFLNDQPPDGEMDRDIDLKAHTLKAIKRVISWSIPNERTIEDVTLLKNVKAIPGPLKAVYKLSDKRATKTLFEQFALPTPAWEILDREFTHGPLLKDNTGSKLECDLVSHMSFPLIAKPLWDCMGHGIEIIHDERALVLTLCANANRNILIEAFIDGALGCVEIIGTPENYVFQPACYTGQSIHGVRSNFDTIRVSHPDYFKTQLNEDIQSRLCDLLNYVSFSGACCVDFIVKGEDIYFLEINPRISGISCLSSAASGINSFEALYLIANGEWCKTRMSKNFINNGAVQIGGQLADDFSPILNAEGEKITIFRDEIIHVDGVSSRNIIAGGCPETILNILKPIDHSILEWLRETSSAVA